VEREAKVETEASHEIKEIIAFAKAFAKVLSIKNRRFALFAASQAIGLLNTPSKSENDRIIITRKKLYIISLN
jgi:hypothetical protein